MRHAATDPQMKDAAPVPDLTVTLTEEERIELARILNKELKDTRVEVHHTHTPGFRDSVLAEERILRSLLAKVQRPSA